MTQSYIVIVDCPPGREFQPGGDVVVLDEGLYLVRTAQTRSELYHAVKRRLNPAKLLVAPLSDLPKFKGMRPSSTALARSLIGAPPESPSRLLLLSPDTSTGRSRKQKPKFNLFDRAGGH